MQQNQRKHCTTARRAIATATLRVCMQKRGTHHGQGRYVRLNNGHRIMYGIYCQALVKV